MVVRDRVGDVLQQHGLAGARRRNDQRALALADRGDDVDDAGGEVLLGRVLVFHLQPLVGIERRQVVEVDLVARLLGVLEIERVDLEQGKIAFAFLRAADVAVDRVAGTQAEAADLRGRDVDVVRPRQIVRLRRAQEAEAIRQHLDDALPDNIGLARGELLEDAEHQLLLAHRRGVLNLEFLGKRHELRRSLGLEFLEFHFPHTECPMEIGQRSSEVAGSLARKGRRSWAARAWGPVPDALSGSIPGARNSIASAYVRWDGAKIGKDCTSGKCRDTLCTVNAPGSERFQHHEDNDRDHQHRGYFVDKPVESLRVGVAVGGEILDPAGEQAVHRRKGRGQARS